MQPLPYRRAVHSDALVSSVMVAVLALVTVMVAVFLYNFSGPSPARGQWALTESDHGRIYVRDYNLTIEDCWYLQTVHHNTACTYQH